MSALELLGHPVWIGPGRVTYLDPDFASPSGAFYPKEDLLQIEFDGTLLLDVGWYPEGNASGAFRVQVLENLDWSQPLFRVEAEGVSGVLKAIRQAVTFIQVLLTARP